MPVVHDFVGLSPEEKANLHFDDPTKKMGLSTSFNARKETVHNWRDYHRHPLEQFVPDCPANPPPFRYLPHHGTMAEHIEKAGWSVEGTGGGGKYKANNFVGCLMGYVPVYEPVMKCDNEITTFRAPKPANRPAEVAANVDTAMELLQEVAANDDVTMPKLPLEVAANIDVTLLDLEVGTITQIMQSVIPRTSAPTRGQVTTSLFVIGSFTALFGLTAMFHLPASGPVFGSYKDSYYIFLAIVLAAAAMELAAAYWLARSGRIFSLAKVGLPVAYLLLLVVFALEGFVIPFSKFHPIS